MNSKAPVFAVIGHPNEGKSSVLATLSEDDSVRISPIPGETKLWQRFPVVIDGEEVIAFVDTPGFQNPLRTLKWFQEYRGGAEDMLLEFVKQHKNDPAFHDECQLMQPLIDGAGIIYVVDGSRPMRKVDLAEMEILRLTGCPRMAILNLKEDEGDFLPDWQRELRKNFNSTRVFNSVKATYGERIGLLESLKSIDQELETVLAMVVDAFKRDWQNRIEQTAELIAAMLLDILSWQKTISLTDEKDEEAVQKKLEAKFNNFINKKEKETQKKIRQLFKHNVFAPRLPEKSILREDLLSEKSWRFLGVSQRQLIMAGAAGGAALGISIDAATIGTSFGLFALAGGLIGAAGTALKGKELLSGVRILGLKMDNRVVTMGPVNNLQLLYIFLDRVLLYIDLLLQRSHARQGDFSPGLSEKDVKQGHTVSWSNKERKTCANFFRSATADNKDKLEHNLHEFISLLKDKLDRA